MPLYRWLSLAGSALLVPALYVRSRGSPALRRRFGERLGRLEAPPPTPGRRRLWIQAVSVGEVRTAETFIRALRASGVAFEAALSSTTGAGIERAASSGDLSFAFTIDRPRFVRRALDALKPHAYASIETELWPSLLAECGRREIPCLLVNGSVSERSARRYRLLASDMREALRSLKAACVQTSDDAARLVSLGADPRSVVVTGNLKFDAAPSDLETRVEALRLAIVIPDGAPVMIAGSTAPGEERIVAGAYRRIAQEAPGLILVVAPRHRERFEEAARELEASGFTVLRRSRSRGTSPPKPGEVILLDTIGELEAAYALARIAFVGGSLVPRGGQNPIEPARQGVPVLFGPGMDSFRDIASALLACGGAFEVRDEADLAARASALLRDGAARESASESARRFVQSHSGAVRRTLEALAHLLPGIFAPAPRAAS